MNHDALQEKLTLLVFDELADAERGEVFAHLQTCTECRQQYTELRQAAALLVQGVNAGPAPSLARERWKRVLAARPRSKVRTGIGVLDRLLAAMLFEVTPGSRLIPVLIVVAIFAIVAGMCLPVLSKAREKPRGVTAEGRRKQMELEKLMDQGEAAAARAGGVADSSDAAASAATADNSETITKNLRSDGTISGETAEGAEKRSSWFSFHSADSYKVPAGSGVASGESPPAATKDIRTGADSKLKWREIETVNERVGRATGAGKEAGKPADAWSDSLFVDGHVEGAKPSGQASAATPPPATPMTPPASPAKAPLMYSRLPKAAAPARPAASPATKENAYQFARTVPAGGEEQLARRSGETAATTGDVQTGGAEGRGTAGKLLADNRRAGRAGAGGPGGVASDEDRGGQVAAPEPAAPMESPVAAGIEIEEAPGAEAPVAVHAYGGSASASAPRPSPAATGRELDRQVAQDAKKAREREQGQQLRAKTEAGSTIAPLGGVPSPPSRGGPPIIHGGDEGPGLADWQRKARADWRLAQKGKDAELKISGDLRMRYQPTGEGALGETRTKHQAAKNGGRPGQEPAKRRTPPTFDQPEFSTDDGVTSYTPPTPEFAPEDREGEKGTKTREATADSEGRKGEVVDSFDPAPAMARSGMVAQEMAEQASRCVQRGEFARADEMLSAIAREFPDHPNMDRLMLQHGVVQYRLGNVDQAVTTLNELARKYPRSPLAAKARSYASPIGKHLDGSSSSGTEAPASASLAEASGRTDDRDAESDEIADISDAGGSGDTGAVGKLTITNGGQVASGEAHKDTGLGDALAANQPAVTITAGLVNGKTASPDRERDGKGAGEVSDADNKNGDETDGADALAADPRVPHRKREDSSRWGRTEKQMQVERVARIQQEKIRLEMEEELRKAIPDKAEREDEIHNLLEKGRVLYESQRDMRAREQFEQVLTKDPYNVVATRYLKAMAEDMRDDAQRKRLKIIRERVAEIEWKYVDPVPSPEETDGEGNSVVRDRTDAMLIPDIHLRDTPLSKALEVLKQETRRLDPEGRGINVLTILRPPEAGPASGATPPPTSPDEGEVSDAMPPAPPEPLVNLNMKYAKIEDVVAGICNSAGVTYRVEPNAVIVGPPSVFAEPLGTRAFPVNPAALGLAAGQDAIASQEALQRFFEGLGIGSPDGASLRYEASAGRLTVTNTPENLRLVELALRGLKQPAPESGEEASPAQPDTRAIRGKLADIVIPNVEFQEALPSTVADYLTQRAKMLDPEGKGVQVTPGPKADEDHLVTINMNHIPLGELIRYVCLAAGLTYQIKPDGVVVTEPAAASAALPPPALEDADQALPPRPDTDAISDRLKNIIVPSCQFKEATVTTALAYLQDRSKTLDPESKGINLVMWTHADEPEIEEQNSSGGRKVDLNLHQVPLGDLIRYVCLASGLYYRVEPNAIVITDVPQAPEGSFDVAALPVPAEFGGNDDSIRSRLAERGVVFPEGARLKFVSRLGKVFITNTPENLGQAEAVLSGAARRQPETGPLSEEAANRVLAQADEAAGRGELAVAENLLRQVVARAPSPGTMGQGMLKLSQVYVRQGNGESAYLLLREAVDKWQNAPLGQQAAELLAKLPEQVLRPPEGEALPAPPSQPAPPVNPFVLTEQDRFSTFALEADTASYALTRRYLMHGWRPPPAVVRMEEFINAFDYQYEQQTEQTFQIHAGAAPSPFRGELVLLRVGVKGKVLGRDGRRPAHLVFVVDVSGSMARADRLPLVKQALTLLLGQLDERDRITLVTYDSRARLVLEAAPVAEAERIRAAVNAVTCTAATNLLAGMELGYQLAQRHLRAGEINRVILCSDGAANIGPTDAPELLARVAEYRDQGITLTTVGVGSGGYNDQLLEQLANKGDGNYVYIDSEAQARRVFVEEMSGTLQMIAKDVKIQVEFNPQRIRRYRLIGYENRAIADQDFRNDKVDAGEIGSGQSATALYELELQGEATADLGTVFIRYKKVDSGLQVEEISRRLEPALVAERTPESDPRFFLAAATGEFAELLRGSEYVSGSDLQQVEQVVAGVAKRLPLDWRVQELLALVRKAQGVPVAQ